MKKFVSIFMVAVMASTMGIHNQVIADNDCQGEACHSTNLNEPENSQADVSAQGEANRDGEETLQGWAWCKSDPKECAVYACDYIANKTGDVASWLGERYDEVVDFGSDVKDFYNINLQNKPKWPFWSALSFASVGFVKVMRPVMRMLCR